MLARLPAKLLFADLWTDPLSPEGDPKHQVGHCSLHRGRFSLYRAFKMCFKWCTVERAGQTRFGVERFCFSQLAGLWTDPLSPEGDQTHQVGHRFRAKREQLFLTQCIY